MNMTKLVLAGLMSLGLSVPAFAGSFEGVVTMKETSDGEATLKRTYFKGDKMREDHSDGDYMVWDAAKKEGLIVDAKKRTVIVMPWPDVKSVDAKKMFEGATVKRCVNGVQAAVLSGCWVVLRSTLPDDVLTPSLNVTPAATSGSSSGAFSFRHDVSATRSIFQMMAVAPSTRL